jgi:hypothetical protein
MAESDLIKKRREIRIVGYEKRLLIVQMLLLAAVLLLPALAVSDGWAAGLLCVVFFGLILAVFVQVWKLRATGLCVIIEEVESQPDETEEEIQTEETTPEPEMEESPPTEPEEEKPHWSDLAYPDPDEELGLAEESTTPSPTRWSQTPHPDLDE